MLFLLPCPADSVDIVVVVVMGWHCRHALMGMVLVVVGVLLRQLPVPVVALPGTGLGVGAGIALWGLVGSLLAWLVVLRYSPSVVRISGGGIPWYYR